ncbi:hypothetical protein ACLMJK_005936 [Lecanora helva]
MSAIDCMPSGLTYKAGLTECKSAEKLLVTLAAFNVWSAGLSLVLGHIWIRRISPTCTRSKEWSAWGSLFLTLLHPASMVVATITIRINGFYPNVFLTFAMWTMRPRMFGPLLWWIIAYCVQRTPDNAYLWTFKDHVVEESLLNILSLPFALFFGIAHQYVKGGDSCKGDANYERFWLSFYIMIAAGVISLVLLVVMILHWSKRCFTRAGSNKAKGFYQMVPGTPTIYVSRRPKLSSFWKWTLTFGGLNMLVSFAGQWILWGTFIYTAGTDWCPGSLVGEGIAWASALFLINLGRPVLGGPASG